MSPDILTFLSDLNAQGIRISREADHLHISAPKGAVTPALQKEIVARKSEILSFLSKAQPEGVVQLDALLPVQRNGAVPLSFFQQDLWPLIERNPGSSAYQMVYFRQLKFRVDFSLLEQALTIIWNRHEILRTSFPVQNGLPVQVIAPTGRFPLEIQDLKAIPAEQRESQLRILLAREAAVPLDPSSNPLLRILAFQLDQEETILLQIIHFLVSDCIGQSIFDRELANQYGRLAGEATPPLQPLAVQYADYALWQRDQIDKGNFRDQIEYWARQLAPPLPGKLVLDGQRLDTASSTKAVRRSIVLTASLTSALNALARQANSTLYVVMLAVFGMFLSAHSDQLDLLVGTPVASRNQPKLENVIGRFLNTLVLRLDCSGAPSFINLLEKTRQTVMEAFSNQDAPIVKVMETLRKSAVDIELPDPLFQVQLNFAPLSDEVEEQKAPSHEEEIDLDQSDARYPLTLYVSLAGESILLKLITQEGLFSTPQLDEFLQQIKIILEGVAEDPRGPIHAYLPGVAFPPAISLKEEEAPPGAIVDAFDPLLREPAHTGQANLIEEPPDSTGGSARREEIEQALIEIWKRLLKVDQVSAHDDFFALGGYSLLALRMVHDVHQIFGVNIPLNLVFRHPRIEKIAEILQYQIGKHSWDSLVEIQTSGKKPPVYFVHGITGDMLWFEKFAKYLGPDQPIYGLQARGLDGVQAPQESIEDMAELYVQEIRRCQPHGPYQIAGYSFGGVVAFEMACQLQESGQEVSLLLVIDQPNPRSDYYTVRLSPAFIVNTLRNLPYRLREIMRWHPGHILKKLQIKLGQTLRDFFWAVKNPGREPRPHTPDEVVDYAASLPIYIQDIIRLGYASLLKYQPRYYPGKLTLIRAKGERLLCSHDTQMGWGNIVDRVDVRVIPGAHWGLFQEPHIRDLSNMIAKCLEQIQER